MLCCAVDSEMAKLKDCQGAVLKRNCGPAAADVLNKLFDIALHDPHYLRFGYRPDCRLHGAEPVPSPHQTQAHIPQDDTSSTNTHMPQQGGHDRDQEDSVQPDASNQKEPVHQPGNSRSAAVKHQRASFIVFPIASLLVAAATSEMTSRQ